MSTTSLGTTITLKANFETAKERTIAALKAEGFGVLTTIDVKATLKKKIDIDFRPYTILGACNPPLAHRALSADPQIGLLLPCNVTISQVGENEIEVAIIDPLIMLGVADNPALTPIAEQAAAGLKRAAQTLQEV